jgi:hypothetical protein
MTCGEGDAQKPATRAARASADQKMRCGALRQPVARRTMTSPEREADHRGASTLSTATISAGGLLRCSTRVMANRYGAIGHR